MTTAVFARAGQMADQVREESQRVDVAKVLLTLVFLVPFVLGYLAGALINLAGWLWAALIVGYRAARPGDDGPAD